MGASAHRATKSARAEEVQRRWLVVDAEGQVLGRLATRVSVNLEGPSERVVRALAPEKSLAQDLLPKLALAGRLARESRLERRPGHAVAAGITTQFVVGAQGDTDREILGLVGRLERQGLLHHAHFSAFQPVVGTPMEGHRPVPAARELRLYQAEHLLRRYGFGFVELPFDPAHSMAVRIADLVRSGFGATG